MRAIGGLLKDLAFAAEIVGVLGSAGAALVAVGRARFCPSCHGMWTGEDVDFLDVFGGVVSGGGGGGAVVVGGGGGGGGGVGDDLMDPCFVNGFVDVGLGVFAVDVRGVRDRFVVVMIALVLVDLTRTCASSVIESAYALGSFCCCTCVNVRVLVGPSRSSVMVIVGGSSG